jgi:hypothetical protein
MADGKPGAPRGHPRWGGRAAGTPNAATVAKAEAIENATANLGLTPEKTSKLTPLQIVLVIAETRFSAGDHAGALAAAAIALPYCAPRLSSGDVKVTTTAPQRSMADVLAEIDAVRAVGEDEPPTVN